MCLNEESLTAILIMLCNIVSFVTFLYLFDFYFWYVFTILLVKNFSEIILVKKNTRGLRMISQFANQT